MPPPDDVTIDFVFDQLFAKVMSRLQNDNPPDTPDEARNLYIVGAILTLAVITVDRGHQ
jgi:hypothetical protein